MFPMERRGKMVKNINKLKGKMAENSYTLKRLSEELGITENTLRRKMNDESSEFTVGESDILRKKLKLTTEEFLNIFFE